jgi:hypothetical protein
MFFELCTCNVSEFGSNDRTWKNVKRETFRAFDKFQCFQWINILKLTIFRLANDRSNQKYPQKSEWNRAVFQILHFCFQVFASVFSRSSLFLKVFFNIKKLLFCQVTWSTLAFEFYVWFLGCKIISTNFTSLNQIFYFFNFLI